MEIACIVCPISCVLTVEKRNGTLQISGEQCPRGAAFAEQEIHDPKRILTTTVKLTNGGLLPVRSSGTVKKTELKALVNKLKQITIVPPVEIGQIIIPAIGEVAVDIVATDNAI